MNIASVLDEVAQKHPLLLDLSDEKLIEILTQRMHSRQDYWTQTSNTYRKLERIHQRLIKVEKVQGRFLALMRDKFQINLENMRVLLSALNEAQLYEEDVQFIFEMIMTDVLSMQFHIDNVSMASHIDSGTLTSNISDFAVKDLLLPLEESLCPLLLQQDQDSCEILIDENLFIRQDADKLLIILRNALSNALRFSVRGGKSILQVQALGDTHIEIIVRNKGDDIIDKEIIFDAFYQEDISYGRSQHGLGLGLSVVKGLVSFMNGEVEMTRVDDYNQLYIILPILTEIDQGFGRFSIDPCSQFVFADEEETFAAF